MGWFRRTKTDGGGAPTFEERLAQITPGVPGRCPACGGLGYIDSIDIGHRYQIQHCTDCLHRWEYLFDTDGVVVGLTELDPSGRPVARARVRPTRPVPVLVEEPPAPPVPADDEGEPDVVLDLRDEVVEAIDAPDLDPGAPEELSPAEWLRRSVQR